MARRIHTVLGISAGELAAFGVYNGFVDIDSKLYVDPHLLRRAQTPELQGAHEEYCSHFEGVLALLKESRSEQDALFRGAVMRLRFREQPLVALGYAQGDTQGSGIGDRLARRLASTAKQIVDAGIRDPTIFDLVGLIEENIGADRISDMATAILMPRLLAFSQRVASALGVKTRPLEFHGHRYSVPIDPGTSRPVLLLPRELLRTLPVARDWSEVDLVLEHNIALRRRVNAIIGSTWKAATRHGKKHKLRELLLAHPELLRDLLEKYKGRSSRPYDFDNDPEGILSWHDAAAHYCMLHPLKITSFATADLVKVVISICERFGELVENNGLNELFYSDNGALRHERFAQLLFYGVADAYCSANNIDLSREPNAGRGSVDFKVSVGYKARVTVEIKYSSNPSLVRGFLSQLPIYNRAEKACESVYLVLQTRPSTTSIRAVVAARNSALAEDRRVPALYVFDAQRRPPASKAPAGARSVRLGRTRPRHR
ncbi:MAG TPA: hypothetical protein VF017_22415 [Thermoanaerobaculia bacterium]|nr:hypothetical protein [Thermoanaerobaculia bacterium]